MYDCSRCGRFIVVGMMKNAYGEALRNDATRRAVISHQLKLRQRDGKYYQLNLEELSTLFMEDRLPTSHEMMNNLIVWVGNNQRTPQSFAIETGISISGIIGTAFVQDGSDTAGLSWLLKELKGEGLFEVESGRPDGKIGFRLSMKGWNRYADLKHRSVHSNVAFMAMQFGDPELDHAFESCFVPAVRRTGFELRRVTDKQGAGNIDTQIEARIRTARFLIADLTHDNRGAYWEAGLAYGLYVPVIYTCEKGKFEREGTHFDTSHHVTIKWDRANLNAAENELVAKIRNTLPSEAILTD
jgi:hypothetical protein